MLLRILLLIFLAATTVSADELPFVGMSSSAPAKIWQQALVSGNGTMGAMVLGNPSSERVVLNHERLYEPLLDEPCPLPKIADSLPRVRELLLAGKYREAIDHSWKSAQKQGFKEMQWTDPYHPACALTIDQNVDGVQDYLRTTNFESGEITVSWKDKNGNSIQRKTFVSRPDGVIVMQIRSDETVATGSLSLVNQDSREKSKRTDKKGGGYLDPEITSTEDTIEYRCKYTRSKRGYVVVAKVIAIDGKVLQSENDINFDGKETLVLITIESLEDYSNVDEISGAMRKKLDSVEAGYAKLQQRHAAIHGEIFNRVKLDLGGEHLTSEKLIAQQAATKKTDLNIALLEKMFYMGRYTLISSSGEWPPNLMGIWNGEWRPMWSGDFTLDANVNLQIASATQGNLPEAIESYSRLINGLIPDWETNARVLYACRGVVSGIRTSGRDNLSTHFRKGGCWNYWSAGAQWLTLPMFEHYQTHGDEDFLREDLTEVMTKIATFYVDFLKDTDHEGDRIFMPSVSPENKPGNTQCLMAINATLDIACAKEALSNLLALEKAGKLQLDEEFKQECESVLAELPPYLMASDGALKEWAWKGLDDNNNHRHVSHLYPVWPGHEINPEDTPDLFEAATIAAKNRGRGNGSAHGLAHMALIGARLKNSELVYNNLRFMLGNNYLLPSLFTYHNPGRIYNADMLHSLPAVVMEMLVYSKPGEIELLPALSSKILTGKVSGICCRNGVLVEELDWDLNLGRIVVRLKSRYDQKVSLRLRRGARSLQGFHDGNALAVDDGVLQVELKKDSTAELALSWNP